VTVLGAIRPVSARIPGRADAPPGLGASDDWHWKAWRVLTRFGPRTIPALIEGLSTGDDPVIRQFAAESLGRLGDDARGSQDALHRAAHHDESPLVRAAAIAAIEAIRKALKKARAEQDTGRG
jgi:hypothetical protein